MPDIPGLADYLNVLVTLGAAFIAYRAYISTTNDNRSKHVHELFKEYLKARMDTQKDTEEFIGFKLYALEEIYNWIRKIRRSAKNNRRWISQASYQESMLFHDAWLATVQTHLRFDPAETLAALMAYKDCYTPSFFEMALKSLASEEAKA